VVLTEGVGVGAGEEGGGGGGKMLPSEFWDMVVEVKAGVGVLWNRLEGVVRELPEELKRRGMPRGKERGGGGGGRGRGRGRGNNWKPTLMVERDDGEVV
jgi:2'-phosphotransferase